KQLNIRTPQLPLFRGEFPPVEFAVVHPFLMLGHSPVVKYCRPPIVSLKSGSPDSRLPHFLSKINHGRPLVDCCAYHKCRESTPWVSGEEFRSNSLLIMVFEEVHHVMIDTCQAALHFC